jgi:hypothetical protein
MHKHDRRENADVDDEADQGLSGYLGGVRQSIGHAVEGRKDGGENHTGSEASPVRLYPEAGRCQYGSAHLEPFTATHNMKLTKHFSMMTNHAPYIPKVALLIMEKPRW